MKRLKIFIAVSVAMIFCAVFVFEAFLKQSKIEKSIPSTNALSTVPPKMNSIKSSDNPVLLPNESKTADMMDLEDNNRSLQTQSSTDVPVAVPVLFPQEAENANREALIIFEAYRKAQEEAEAYRREIEVFTGGPIKEAGYNLVLNETFQSCETIPISQKQESSIEKKGYDVSEFKSRLFPKQLFPDFSTLPSKVSFAQGTDGFEIQSEEGEFRINTPKYDSMAKSFLFELTATNTSREKELVLRIGSNNTDISSTKHVTLQEKTLHPGETGRLFGFIDVYDPSSMIAPSFEIKGSATIKEFSIWRKDHSEFTVVEGEITERSSLPKPEETDYPNCRFTVRFNGNAILSGKPCNKELALSIDGFQNKRFWGTNDLKTGDKIKCAIIPIEQLPEELASIQEADDLSLFTLDSYLATSISVIPSYKEVPSSEQISFKSEVLNFKSVFEEGVNPKTPNHLVTAQKERIRKDLIAATAMLDDYTKNRNDIEEHFQVAWKKEKERFADGYNTVNGNIWRKIDHSFWSLPSVYTFVPNELKTLPQSKLDALVALKDFLEVNGIQLIVSFVPNWHDISSRIINQDFINVPDYQTAMLTKQLSEAGIECPYMAETLIRNYDKFSLAYLYPRDAHPGSTVQYSVSEVVAERLKDYHFPSSLDAGKFDHKQVVTYGGGRAYHIWPKDCDIGDHEPGEFFTADQIHYDGSPLTPDTNSEILIVGNSSIEFPMSNPDALQAFLAERLLYRVDNLRVDATGPFTTVIQRFFDNPSHYLKGKKVIILQTMDFVLTEETIPWNNIRLMDEQRMKLSGKKLVANFFVSGNGKWSDEIKNEKTRTKWKSFGGLQEIRCPDDKPFEIASKVIDGVDLSKPVLCVVQTIRSSLYKTPHCLVNGQVQDIPAGSYLTELSWQNVFFDLPEGTDTITISIHGNEGTIIGFNQVFIYQ